MKGRLLIVQDHALLRRLLALYLSTAGYRVAEADDSLAAVTAVRESTPDAMIVDLSKPSIDGADLVWRLRRDSSVPTFPVVIFTVAPESDPRIQALLDLPAVAYKAKDDVATLVWTIDDLLGEADLPAEADAPQGERTVALAGHADIAARPRPH